jgi:type I restriction enzyme S subunit
MSQHFGEHAMRNSVKATVDSLRLPTFEKFEIRTPSLDEQQAIATILSDMDAEIEALQARRAKTQPIKQGMMQELLTGRTRLV